MTHEGASKQLKHLFVWLQVRARKFNPWLYWATIVASTTCGTTLADFADRSLGIGYPGGSLLLLSCVLLSLFARLAERRRQDLDDPEAERDRRDLPQ